ncbi:hypothetical protein ZHAS_00007971 [Anopheles sinensis]|uniref:Uncharacterized protein n=1 Tax=Anopheles sinensis TaxID=74873 RepID=A0A084VR90_ANOSI|nr:hypothetical protein ZHAS_00007971 [Anopheles sinensis]
MAANNPRHGTSILPILPAKQRCTCSWSSEKNEPPFAKRARISELHKVMAVLAAFLEARCTMACAFEVSNLQRSGLVGGFDLSMRVARPGGKDWSDNIFLSIKPRT